jgi:hypothetical protein
MRFLPELFACLGCVAFAGNFFSQYKEYPVVRILGGAVAAASFIPLLLETFGFQVSQSKIFIASLLIIFGCVLLGWLFRDTHLHPIQDDQIRETSPNANSANTDGGRSDQSRSLSPMVAELINNVDGGRPTKRGLLVGIQPGLVPDFLAKQRHEIETALYGNRYAVPFTTPAETSDVAGLRSHPEGKFSTRLDELRNRHPQAAHIIRENVNHPTRPRRIIGDSSSTI